MSNNKINNHGNKNINIIGNGNTINKQSNKISEITDINVLIAEAIHTEKIYNKFKSCRHKKGWCFVIIGIFCEIYPVTEIFKFFNRVSISIETIWYVISNINLKSLFCILLVLGILLLLFGLAYFFSSRHFFKTRAEMIQKNKLQEICDRAIDITGMTEKQWKKTYRKRK